MDAEGVAKIDGPRVSQPAFDDEGCCVKCGSKVSFADVTDTIVFVGEEIVKQSAGDITNRNCVRCTYPKQYLEYQDFEEGGRSHEECR